MFEWQSVSCYVCCFIVCAQNLLVKLRICSVYFIKCSIYFFVMDYKADFFKEFIRCYERQRCLWDKSLPEYISRDARTKACKELMKIMGKYNQNCSIDDVKKKINSIRVSFKREMNKLKQFESSGTDNVYKPTIWWFGYCKFLQNLEKPCKPISKMSDEDFEIEPKFKRRKLNSATDELVRLVTHRLKSPENSCHHLAKAWAHKLSKMDQNQRIIAEKIINDIIFNGELGLLNFNTTLINIKSARNLKPTCNINDKNNIIINSSESSLESTPTKNCTTDIVRQKCQTDDLSYQSHSSPTGNSECITDNENDNTEENLLVEEYDPLDNSIKMED